MIQNIGRHDSAVKQASGNQKSTLFEVTNGLQSTYLPRLTNKLDITIII